MFLSSWTACLKTKYCHGLLRSYVFLAQLADKGGAGAWPIGVSGIITLYVALLAYIKKSDITITRTDWLFFIIAMTSLPLWYLTSDPLSAVLILTTVDVLGFAPTFRKAYALPYEEKLTFFVIMAVRNAISILALAHYSLLINYRFVSCSNSCGMPGVYGDGVVSATLAALSLYIKLCEFRGQ